MRLLTGLILFLGLQGPLLLSQVEWFGYLESEFDNFGVGGKTYNFGYNKLRVDLESRPAENVYVAANLNLLQYVGKENWNFLDFIPEKYWKRLFQDAGIPASLWVIPFTYQDSLYLDNAYLKVNFPRLDLIVGKQPLSLGTGYAWNPLDIFNKKDPVDPTYEQTGIQALRVDVPLTSRGGLTGILTPAESWEAATKYLQLKSGWQSFDFSVNWAEYEGLYRYWDYQVYSGIVPKATQYQAYGGSLVGQIFGMGLWAETWRKRQAAFNEKINWETVVGVDYTFPNSLYLLNEYLYNSQGATKATLQLADYFAYFEGETHSLMREYDFFYGRYPAGDFVNVGLLMIANLTDNSTLISPQLDWDIFENGTLSIWYFYPLGEPDSEFGFQDAGWRVRLRAYF